MATTNHMIKIALTDGREVLTSYGVPVAAFVPGRGYVRRARRYSVTTSKHANAYAGRTSPELGEAEFLALIDPITDR